MSIADTLGDARARTRSRSRSRSRSSKVGTGEGAGNLGGTAQDGEFAAVTLSPAPSPTPASTAATAPGALGPDDFLRLRKYLSESLQGVQFLHVTKSGGTSVERWGTKFGGAKWGRSNMKRLKEAASKGLLEGQAGKMKSELWHLPARYFSQGPYRDAKHLFLIVRDPFERLIAEFRCPWKGFLAPVGQDKNKKQRRLNATREDLNTWLTEKLKKGAAKPPFRNGHFVPQHLYVDPPSGKVGEVRILRFENLSEDFRGMVLSFFRLHPNFCERLADHIPELPHTNSSEVPRFRVEDLDEETVSLIEEEYKEDFLRFGYPLRGGAASPS